VRCSHCHRHIKRAAGMSSTGPVGPVCAERLGLPRVLPQTLRKDGLPRARAVRAVPAVRAVVDESQLTLAFV
jgi:hypothetical protein